ncbi:Mediator of RNA polymerase II transcription subunit 10 [Gryganskiella cystojenkinii]|nr:Mediator of RNA polymerase II transcription subunit 10 [Gryganskiella cystojenkinii]
MASATSANAATTPIHNSNSNNSSNTASAFTSPASSSTPRSSGPSAAGPNGPGALTTTTTTGPTGELSSSSTAMDTSPSATEPNIVDLAAAKAEDVRQDLELKLKELIECLLELSITVYDFQPDSNSLVHQKIQELIEQLSGVETFKDIEMMVPMEVLGFIEDGRNPDQFTKSFIESVAGENQFTNGKITAMKTFEEALTQNLGNIFPDELMDYQSIIQDTSSPSSSGGTTTNNAGALENTTSTAITTTMASPPS